MAEKGQAFESVTLGHIRSHGCRDLLVSRMNRSGRAPSAEDNQASLSAAEPQGDVVRKRSQHAGGQAAPEHPKHQDLVRALEEMPVEEMGHDCPAF